VFWMVFGPPLRPNFQGSFTTVFKYLPPQTEHPPAFLATVLIVDHATGNSYCLP